MKEDSTGGMLPEDFDKYFLSDNLKPKDEKILQWEFIERLGKKQLELEKKTDSYKEVADEYKKELTKQGSRNIEIIGIFSAIIALLIMDVNVIDSAPNFLSAILLITSLTASLVIFVSLIHCFFSEETEGMGKAFWIGLSILILFVLIGVLTYFFNINLYKTEIKNKEIVSMQGDDKIVE